MSMAYFANSRLSVKLALKFIKSPCNKELQLTGDTRLILGPSVSSSFSQLSKIQMVTTIINRMVKFNFHYPIAMSSLYLTLGGFPPFVIPSTNESASRRISL